MSETDLIRGTLDAFAKIGIWAVRVNSGGYRNRVRLMPAGFGDILVLDPYGWLEAKDPTKPVSKRELREKQVEFMRRCRARGIRYAKFETRDEAVRIVRSWR